MTSANRNQDKDTPMEEEHYKQDMPASPEQDNQEVSPDISPDDNLQEKVEALEAELNETKDRMMRALAEAENARKRAQKDREDAGKFAISGFAKDLLDFTDNFQRALGAMPEDLVESEPRLANVTSGLEAMERELLNVLDKNGIQKTDPIDEPFDPNFHEVMFEAPMPGKTAGTVIQVIESGFVLNGRLLRAAKVGIAKAEQEGSANAGDNSPGAQIDTEA